MNVILFALAAIGACLGVRFFINHVLCLTMAAATSAVTAAKVQGPNGGVIERTKRVQFAADTGTLYNGVLVGCNSDGYYMKAGDTEVLTDIALYVGQRYEVDSGGSDGDYYGEIKQGIVVPVKIATLTTAAAARKVIDKQVYIAYDNEVQLTRTTYANLAGKIVGYNSVTEVLVEIPIAQEVNPSLSDLTTQIWVDANSGNDTLGNGTRSAPMKTIEAAYALKSATRNTMFILPGTYLPAATMTLPAYDFKFIGIGGPELVIIGGSAAAHLFTRAAGALTATTTFTWQDLDLYNGDTYDAIRVDNTTAGNKIIISIKNCEQEGAGRPINVHTHGDASNAVRIYADAQENEWEGEVYFAVGNDGDIIQIKNCVLSGGFITGTSATVMRISLHNCLIPATHTTGGASQQVCNVKNCHTVSGANETKAVAADIGGSQTVRIVTGAAA
jgi:hypothetical protein